MPSQHFLHGMLANSGQLQLLLVRLSNEQVVDMQSRLNYNEVLILKCENTATVMTM